MYRPEFFTGVVFTAALSLGIQIYDNHTHVTMFEFQPGWRDPFSIFLELPRK